MKKIMMLVGCSFVFTSYAMEQSQSATSPTSDKQSVFPVVKIDVPSSSVRIIKPIAIRLGTIDISSPVQEAASLLMKLHLSSSRMPALHQAAVSGDADSVKQLLNQGSNCNAVDGTGTSPLAYALEKGHYKTAFILLQYGAMCIKNNETFSTLVYVRKIDVPQFVIDKLIAFAAKSAQEARRFFAHASCITCKKPIISKPLISVIGKRKRL